ncbi:transcription initiation factor TFIID, subunit TAF5, partial [Aureobasidium melanogenum]
MASEQPPDEGNGPPGSGGKQSTPRGLQPNSPGRTPLRTLVPASPSGKSPNPVGRPRNSLSRPSTPVAAAGTPVAAAGTPMAAGGTPVATAPHAEALKSLPAFHQPGAGNIFVNYSATDFGVQPPSVHTRAGVVLPHLGPVSRASSPSPARAPPPPRAPTPAPVNPYHPYAYVIDYLAKKGYHRTEATLRAESANQEIPKDADIKPTPPGPPRYFEFFSRLVAWTDDTLDIYKAEVKRLLWPIFVYAYLDLVKKFYPKEANRLFVKYQDDFKGEHEPELRSLQYITLPEHGDDKVAKLYRDNKYRVNITLAAFTTFMTFLESLPDTGFKLLASIVEEYIDVRTVDRAADDRYSFAAVIDRARQGQDMPAEDEGIPGHRPGNAISSTDPTVGNNLATLKLGKLPMEKDLEEDVRGDLMDLDLVTTPKEGRETLVQTHERFNIKQEDEDEGPSRSEIPFPPSTVYDVAIEVQRIREVRDRLKIDSRTGGVGPQLNVVMYTFHNTHDGINCFDISGDSNLIAAGYYASIIRVWTLDGSPLGPEVDGKKQNSRRLIGHSGPVFSVSFCPASFRPDPKGIDPTARWLLSSSADGTVRLWSLLTFAPVVIYKGHVGPVWDVKWGPFGHYFLSSGADKTARIWMTDKIRQVRLLAGHDDGIDCVAWHPNSSYVFTASSDKTVRMWAVTNGNAVRMFTGHTGMITAMACSRDGKLLASADETGVILIWDLAPGRLLKKFRGHGKVGIYSLTWNVESTVLVSGSHDCTVRAWDVTGPAKEGTPATTTATATNPTATATAGPSSTGKAADGATGSKDGDGTTANASTTSAPPATSGSTGGSGTAGPSTTTASGTAAGASGTGAAAGGASGAAGHKKRGKEAGVSNDQISAFLTKNSPVYLTKFTNMNLILAAGCYLPEQAKFNN